MTAASSHRVWRRVGDQLRQPKGLAGRLTGHLMVLLNRGPYRQALKALSLQPGNRVLELGFGPGQGLAALCRLFPSAAIWGVDHSEAMLDMALKRNARAVEEGRLHLACGSFTSLPFPSAWFDSLLLVNVLYFFDDAGKGLTECLRVLKPSGRIVLYVTDRATMENWRFCEPETHRIFNRHEVAASLENAGFTAIDIHPVRLAFAIQGLVITARRERC
ncbi:methyltransferase domain-containing protein [Allorhizobium sp. BGMRC 0089]|uniref:class I SAM-dependent methyltransferase n=1 Tax=Allorhizobium sonneratiae TaxID=2934936 RepID=UPI0020338A24|nr:methyltransferase domain-containing protein [Allorhizobium sonneratiae]MCM2293789.1 methyltransferase domain-containing protein [Allorhizobium sonneratiae]